MKMSEKAWTIDQSKAIEARGGSLLISAAAGSGKTAVLVERILQRITDVEDPCDIDSLLVVTFTNAAAAEMRARLGKRIQELFEQKPEDTNLRRQQILLQHAHISTIHAFCIELIRAHFEKLNIPPDFRIAEEQETESLFEETLNELLEEENATQSDEFYELSRTLGAGRDDFRLVDTIRRLFDFLQSLPNPDEWLDEQNAKFSANLSVTETVWGEEALSYIAETLRGIVDSLQSGLDAMMGCEPLEKAYAPAFLKLKTQVESALGILKGNDWDELCEAVQHIENARLGSARKLEDTFLRERLKAIKKAAQTQLNVLAEGLLNGRNADFQQDMNKLRPIVRILSQLVKKLRNRFFKAKIDKGMLDFGDLEHLALQLLKEPDGNITETAKLVSSQFCEVLVDEYQDVNPLQDALFTAVSRDGANLCMVGDVKQSIYRFRRATPELFLKKKETSSPYDGRHFPARIILGKNFRSRAGIVDAVNFAFGQLMSYPFGGIDYKKEDYMTAAASYFEKPVENADFEMTLLETDGYPGNEDNAVLEARYIAQTIRKMMEMGQMVQGEDGPRPLRYRDICILLRSANRLSQTFLDALKQEGLPGFAEVTGGYLSSYEVEVILSLIRLLDNPLQDIPLLSVMLSPIFGFSPDDIAALRLAYPKGNLYLAILEEGKKGNERFHKFLEQIGELRQLASVLPSDRLILRVYEQTGALSIFSAMPNGEMRRSNLRLLLDYARNFESTGYHTLSDFIRYINQIAQNGDLQRASSVTEEADTVRIMSIHKAKGLEFPVCILAGCGRRFNRADIQPGMLFHPKFGFGGYIRDPSLCCHFNTLPREVVRIETEHDA
ncbi:MAG TPA: helicase-exonuclease AddAB subunit AddA, partial [Ruminococcaceae bacterium]|nr:helicase-exonuclease AddAB subunit AddA [Oscillospiraceae bacterium]